MIRLRHKFFIHSLRLLDQLILAFSLFITVAFSKGVDSVLEIYIVFQREYKLFETAGLIGMIIAWIIIFSRFLSYDTNRFINFGSQIFNLAKACTSTAFLLLLAGAIFEFENLNIQSIAIFWSLSIGFGTLLRLLIRLSLVLFRKSSTNLRHILVVGTNPEAVDTADRLQNNDELGCEIVGHIDAPSFEEEDYSLKENLNIVGTLDDLQSILEKGTVDEILICLPFQKNVSDIFSIITLGHDLGVVVRYIPKTKHKMVLRDLHIEQFEGTYILTLFRERFVMQLFIKRLMDLAISATMLSLLSPLLIAVALAVKSTSNGPIFFGQERIGMNKRRFTLYKFRSMVANAEDLKEQLMDQNEVDGPVFKIKRDPRITNVGRFIRKTSIDELPQLWNVFRGDMTLVGPRPPLLKEVNQYEWLFRRRLSIKPGITCLWQVSGRNELSFEEWMELDKRYIDNWSIWLDLKILFMTIPVVLLGKGAS